MTAPKEELVRLRDQGVDLDDSAALGGYDLEGMRAAIDARTSTGGGPGGGPGGGMSAQAVALAASAVLVVGLGVYLFWPDPPDPEPELAIASVEPPPRAAPAVVADPPRVAAPVEPTTPPVAAARATEVAAAAKTAQTETAPAPASAPARAPAADETEPVAAPIQGTDSEAAAPNDAPQVIAQGTETASPSETGDLALQNALMRQGQDAMDAGRLADAAAAYQQILERWPAGPYRDDALVAVLDIIIRGGDWASVEPLAAQLSEIPSLAARHAEFRRVRAEALVHLGRCSEALAIADSLSRQESATIRRSCRNGIAP